MKSVCLKSVIAMAWMLLLVPCAMMPQGSQATEPARPSILVFVADDVGWQDFGCYGNRAIRTPSIDALARDGVLFENAFLTSSQCSPTRISVLTGRYPHATGAEDLHMPLPEGGRLVPSYLGPAGYFTGHMQKTHYGPRGVAQFDWYSKKLDDFPKFLDEADEQPFFMWVGFHDAHRPYAPGAVDPPHDPQQVIVPPYLADTPETRADLALYYDEVSRMDEAIGRFVAELKRRDRLDDTMIVFFSDNGAPFPRAKGSLYDVGVGTPLIFRWPARAPRGKRSAGLASVIDLAPTWLAAAGVTIPSEMQGHGMLDRVEDPSLSGREFVFSERNWHNCDEHMRSLRSDRYKLIHNAAYTELPFGSPADVSRSPSWTSLRRLESEGRLTPAQAWLFQKPRPEWELYDVSKDPGEFENLAARSEMAQQLERLQTRLTDWSQDTGDFSPESRRRDDNTNRETGVKETKKIAPLRE
jgi:arylsulfatase A-like enzyme